MNEPDNPAPSPDQQHSPDTKGEVTGTGKEQPQPKKEVTFRQALPGCVIVVLLIAVLVGGGVGLWRLTTSGVRSRLAEADRLWTEGQKADAAAVYAKLAEKDLLVIYGDNRVQVFQRLVEYALEQGDIASANSHLGKASKEKVKLPPELPQKVQDRAGQLAAERTKKEAEEREATAKVEQEKKGAALKAERDRKEAALKAEHERNEAALKKKLEQVPDLIRRLKDENSKVRAVAAAGLAEIKPLPSEALEALLITVKEVGDSLSPLIRLTSAQALGNCDPGDGRSIKALTEAIMSDEDAAVQTVAFQALSKLGNVGIPGISKALTHSSHQMRLLAAGALGRAGKDARSSVPDLLKAMKDEQDDQARIMMAGAALRLDPDEPSPIPVLIKGLDPGRDPVARRIAADYLAEAGSKATVAVPALEAMLTSSDPADVRVAKKALEKIKK